MYIRFFVFGKFASDTLIDYMPTAVDYLIRIIVIVLLIVDFKKYNIKNGLITCIAALFFPLLGIVIFSLLFIAKGKELDKNKANA